MDDSIYKGYKEIVGTTDEINQYMSKIDFNDWFINEYILIRNTDDDSESEMKFDGEKFVALKLPPSRYIKAKNALQRCALDILNNKDITVAAILGGYGSGKTMLSTLMSLYGVQEKGWQSKILGVRSPVGEGKSVGYLRGDLLDKTMEFFMPLVDQLSGGEFELDSLRQRGILDSNIPFYLKGRSLNSCCILVDEAEDLTMKEIRLIGTRLGEDSRIILNGDYKQSTSNATISNPLVQMCNKFKGQPKFGCIYLGEDVRSSTSKMFATLLE